MAVGRAGTGGFLSREDMGGPPGRFSVNWRTHPFWLKVMMFSTNKELQYLFRANKLNNAHIMLSNPRFEIPGVKLLEAESCHVFFLRSNTVFEPMLLHLNAQLAPKEVQERTSSWMFDEFSSRVRRNLK